MSATPTAAPSFVVVGAGLAGSATAWQLARRGCRVTVLEQTSPAHPGGSSHGSARIFRYAYPDPFYADLVVQARRAWDELEHHAGQQLIRRVGALDFGVERDPALLSEVLDACNVVNEIVPVDQVAERWPGIAADTEVLWHPDAGVLDAQSAVLAMVRLAVEAGADVRQDWRVAKVERARHGYRVTSEDGAEVRADGVVVAVGGWLPDLLADLPGAGGLVERMPPLTVRQEQVFHFPYRDPDRAAAWPTFIHKAAGLSVYSLPGGRDAGFRGQKVAEYATGRIIESAAASDRVVDPLNRERVTAYVERFLPGLVPEPYAEATCLFTSTPDEDFVLDRLDGLTVVSPCSGHGAKFAPLVGELAASLAMGEDIEQRSKGRFRLPDVPVTV